LQIYVQLPDCANFFNYSSGMDCFMRKEMKKATRFS
jgi:hypothetical protein